MMNNQRIWRDKLSGKVWRGDNELLRSFLVGWHPDIVNYYYYVDIDNNLWTLNDLKTALSVEEFVKILNNDSRRKKGRRPMFIFESEE